MKAFIFILATVFLITFSSAIAGEVEIKEGTLKYQDVATREGGELFNNICAVCHGAGGKGDGPAAPALNKPVADLTALSANNDGVYPHDYVKDAIAGKSRVVAHGTIDMPVWGEQLLALRPDWNSLRRKAFTQERIDSLTMHIESIQVE